MHSHDSSFQPSQPDGTNPTISSPISADGRPIPGELYLVPARQGRAVRLAAGDVLTIINTHGTQVCDFWAFNAADVREFVSMPHVHGVISGVYPRAGQTLVSNRRRALLSLLSDSSVSTHDTVIAACDIYRYRQLGVTGYHDNCTDNLRMALLAIGSAAAEIPAPLNFWMNTPVAADGKVQWLPPVSVPGDRVELRAECPLIAVMSACPQDLVPINGTDNTPKDIAFSVTVSQVRS
jgi:uncharacterized protein